MKRIRVAGLIEMEGGYALMHRMNVKPSLDNPNKPHGEYYVFPGGGQEGDESYEQGTIREIKEEFGIDVEILEKLYEKISFNCSPCSTIADRLRKKSGCGDG